MFSPASLSSSMLLVMDDVVDPAAAREKGQRDVIGRRGEHQRAEHRSHGVRPEQRFHQHHQAVPEILLEERQLEELSEMRSEIGGRPLSRSARRRPWSRSRSTARGTRAGSSRRRAGPRRGSGRAGTRRRSRAACAGPRNGEKPKNTPSAKAAAVRSGVSWTCRSASSQRRTSAASEVNHRKWLYPGGMGRLTPSCRTTTARSAVHEPMRVSGASPWRCGGGQAPAQSRPRGEQQLVVVAAGDGLVDRVATLLLEPPPRVRFDRQRAAVDRRADAARLGELVHRVGQPVAEVHARGGGAIASEQRARAASAAPDRDIAGCRARLADARATWTPALSICKPAAAAPIEPVT